MKKTCLLSAFILMCITQLSPFSIAGSLEEASNDPITSFRDQVVQLESAYGIEVIQDNFGGYLYFYRDSKGNRHVSNNMENILDESSLAQVTMPASSAEMSERDLSEEPDEDLDFFDEFDEFYEEISDPLEPVNRFFFHFNDKLYFWLLKPVASGYKTVVPEPARIGVDNFFSNLAFPVRFINCLLQAKFEGAGYEWGRFMLNSTIGIAGFFDVAGKHFDIKEYDEDLGQALGSYGFGPGFFINWPFFGPSSLRDSIGDAGDAFLNPIYYFDLETNYKIAIKAFDEVNDKSLTIGEYEDLKKSALDPYIAFRDIYFQNRQSKIKE